MPEVLDESKQPRDRPFLPAYAHRFFKEMAASGRRGRINGKGFYNYPDPKYGLRVCMRVRLSWRRGLHICARDMDYEVTAFCFNWNLLSSYCCVFP